MKWSIIFICLLAQLTLRAAYPVIVQPVCGTNYNITASLNNSHGKLVYSVVVIQTTAGLNRKVVVSTNFSAATRASILKTLSDSLHSTAIFVLSAGCTPESWWVDIDAAVNALLVQVYPNILMSLDDKVLDQNNHLRLIKLTTNDQYYLSNITPGGSTTLVSLTSATAVVAAHYTVNWGAMNVITPTSQLIRDKFGDFLKLYFLISETAAKPFLYLSPPDINGNHQVYSSDDGHTATPTGVFISTLAAKTLLGPPAEGVIVGGAIARLFQVNNPNAPGPFKQTKNEAISKEEVYH